MVLIHEGLWLATQQTCCKDPALRNQNQFFFANIEIHALCANGQNQAQYSFGLLCVIMLKIELILLIRYKATLKSDKQKAGVWR